MGSNSKTWQHCSNFLSNNSFRFAWFFSLVSSGKVVSMTVLSELLYPAALKGGEGWEEETEVQNKDVSIIHRMTTAGR